MLGHIEASVVAASVVVASAITLCTFIEGDAATVRAERNQQEDKEVKEWLSELQRGGHMFSSGHC